MSRVPAIGFDYPLPPPGRRLRRGHWSTDGLRALLLPNSGSPSIRVYDPVRDLFTPIASVGHAGQNKPTANGLMSLTNANDSIDVADDQTQVINPLQTTILLVRQKLDIGITASTAFCSLSGTAADVCGANLPWNDGNLYWSFGGYTDGTTRVTVSGFAVDLEPHVYVLTAGPHGMWVFEDGRLLGGHSTPAAGPSSYTGPFQLGAGPAGSDLQTVSFFAVLDAEWNAQQVQQWTAQQDLMFARPSLLPFLDLPPGQFTVELNGEDVTDLIQTGTDFQDPHFEFEVGQPGVLEFDIELTVKPAKFQKVVLWNKAGTQRVFGGIVEYAKQLDVLYAAPLKAYRVTALDYSRFFDLFYWTKRYETDKTLKEVLQDFWAENDIASAIVDGGYALTLSAAQADGPTISGPFTYDNVKGSAVIADLEQRSKESATPMVRSMTPSGVFRMREYGDTVAPVTLSTALQNMSAFRASDSTQIRANTIIGTFGTTGEGEDEIRHEWAPADGVQTTFSLEGYNVPASSTPPGVVRIDGVDTPMLLPHEAGANDIEWNHALDGGSVIFNGSSSSLVPLGTVLSVLYVPKYPFTVRRTNGGTPRVEATYSDPKVSHYAQAVQALDAELASSDQDPRIFDAETLEDGFELYQLAQVDVPEMDADDTEGIVTGVRAVLHTADPDEVEASFWEYSLVIEELGSGAVLQADPTTRLRQAVRSAV